MLQVNLYELKTYHEVIDEIYYKVSHLEPWEKGSRKTAGQTGMCGGVSGARKYPAVAHTQTKLSHLTLSYILLIDMYFGLVIYKCT